jgi:hypothetical protein
MGRIRRAIQVNGRQCWTLFDTGARNTYVVPAVARLLTTSNLPHPVRSAIGGEVRQTDTTALLQAEIEGYAISTHALVVDQIGPDEDGKPIEILFGALAMQQWGIRLVPDEERLDLSRYPKEFVEFWATAPTALKPGVGKDHLASSPSICASSSCMLSRSRPSRSRMGRGLVR